MNHNRSGLTRHISYKPRRQLVHCRIDVVTTWRNVVVNSSYLGIIPYYVAASRPGPVITRTMSPRSTGLPEHARTYDNRQNVYENCTTIYGWVTRSVREKLRPLWTPSCGEIFKPFKCRHSPTMYEKWRHFTRAANTGRHLFDFPTICGEFLTHRM